MIFCEMMSGYVEISTHTYVCITYTCPNHNVFQLRSDDMFMHLLLVMVSTHLKSISQIWNLQIGVNIKNIWNHHLDEYVSET